MRAATKKYAPFFERQLEGNGNDPDTGANGWLVGEGLTYADVLLFEVCDQISHSDAKALGHYPHLTNHYATLGRDERLKAFLESDKRKSKSQATIVAYRAAVRNTLGL